MLVVDRFEGKYAVVETSSGMVSIPKTDLPQNLKEGDVLCVVVDETTTAQRKAKIKGLMDDLFL